MLLVSAPWSPHCEVPLWRGNAMRVWLRGTEERKGTQWECGWEERKREREGNWANGERGREPKPK
jgi:RNase P subunit RPR2